MLTAHHLTKSYNINPVLNDISFSINAGDRIGLIGPNGAGKTTLLRLLTGAEQPDKGQIVFAEIGGKCRCVLWPNNDDGRLFLDEQFMALAQLRHMLAAIGSGEAAIEDEKHIVLPFELGERYGIALIIGQRKIRRRAIQLNL